MLPKGTIDEASTKMYAPQQASIGDPAPSRRYAQAMEWWRLCRFVVVGATSTALDFLILIALKSAASSTLLANTFAFSIGTVYNFAASRWWTYAGERRKPIGLQFIQFAIASALGLALNDGIVLLLEAPLGALLGGAALSYLPAKIVATGSVAVLSWVTNCIWIFNNVA